MTQWLSRYVVRPRVICGRRTSSVISCHSHFDRRTFHSRFAASQINPSFKQSIIIRSMSTQKICDKLVIPDDSIIAAPCTPLTVDGAVDLDKMEQYCDHMVSTGATGIFVNGTLGEGMSLTVAERKQTLEKWMQLAPSRFNVVIAHCGATAYQDARELCAHAEKVSANAIAVMCPLLFKPANVKELVGYLASIATAAPNTPFLYYDINVLTGFITNTLEVMRECKAAIPNFAGIKYSCRELGNYEAAMMESENGRYKMMVGTVDEVFLPWMTLGARVPICHSMMGSIHAETKARYLAGDQEAARLSQLKACRTGLIKRKYGADVPVSKAILKMKGMDLGPVLPPLIALTQEQYDELEKELRDADLL